MFTPGGLFDLGIDGAPRSWFAASYYMYAVFISLAASRNPEKSLGLQAWLWPSARFHSGVTGYSLPYDQVGYWALRIVSGVPDCIPVVGQVLVELIRGGPSVGQATLTRFYSLHTFVLPLVTLALMLVHFLLIRKQGISGPL